ncbi:MAG: precorrin-2 C(20)-methyltransferase [Coprococcus sp.]
MAGCLYSVGVGPGDPELMTLKAVRCIRKCPVIIIPTADKDSCMAYKIALQEIPEITEKECISAVMPMTKDRELLRKSHEAAATAVADILAEGKDAAFLTIGDPTVYATPMYIHQRIAEMGFETRIVSGVPSFCAAAGRMKTALAEGREQIHIIPASYDVEEALNFPGTKILMKAGTKMPRVKDILRQRDDRVMMIENCGMADEKIWTDVDSMPECPGYYTLAIVKEKRGGKR